MPIPRWQPIQRLALAALAGGAFALTGCSRSAAPVEKKPRAEGILVTVARVEVAPLDRTLPVVGTLLPRIEAVVGAQVEGQVQKTFADFGDRVAADQELALIDTDSYQAIARQAAANLAKAQANLQNTESSLKRVQALQKDKISSASDLDSAVAQAEEARAEVKAVRAAEAIAQLNLARSHVKAPFPGAVAERIASAGDFVKVGAPLYRLVDDLELKYLIQAPERYAGQVKLDQPVVFTVDASPGETFTGKVRLINPSVSLATRSFNVGALVPNPDRKLKANTFARGELILERAVPTPMVPLEAVLNFAGVTKVFVIEGDTAHARPIKTGRVHEGRQEVVEGLKPGETVALTGSSKLYENAKVRLQGTEPAEARTANR